MVRKTGTINACIPVNLCNSDVWTWYNCVQSIYVAMIQIYEMTVFSEIVCPYISETWIRNNSTTCNSICVTVIHIHEIIVLSVTYIYMKYYSSILEFHYTGTCNNGVYNHDN